MNILIFPLLLLPFLDTAMRGGGSVDCVINCKKCGHANHGTITHDGGQQYPPQMSNGGKCENCGTKHKP